MRPATHLANQPRFSGTELKVQAIARRNANSQLVRVPWSKFRKAYEEYPRWHALILWTQMIITSQCGNPSWLTADLQKRCPGLKLTQVGQPEPAGLRLSNWVRNHKFGYAKRQGWLDALTFYGVRHLCSECAWAYWEQCGLDWDKHKPERFPSFDLWWREVE